jgi:hypothetical protein
MLAVSRYIMGCIRGSHNDLEAFPQAMGDGLQLSLRAPRENAAHGSYYSPVTGAAWFPVTCILGYYRAFSVSRCSCDIKRPFKAHAHEPRGVVTSQTSRESESGYWQDGYHLDTVTDRFRYIKHR